MNAHEREIALEILTEQEQRLIFDSFCAEDAWRIGTAIQNKLSAKGVCAVVTITCNGMLLFTCCINDVCCHNFTWVNRKCATVLEFGKSSYRVALELEKAEKTLEERGVSSMRCAASGGGFPIRLTHSGVIGVLAISGMTQQQDHQTIVDAVSAYLNREVPTL